MRILVVEDNEKLASALKKGLEQVGFAVDLLADGSKAMRRLEFDHGDYDLLILDRMLPGMDGLEICKALRNKRVNTPILMLTAKDSLDDKIDGLNAGADDYMVKPFDFPELIARVQALLRRPVEKFVPELTGRGITLNPVTHVVMKNGKDVILTRKEFSMLEQFLRHQNEVISREQLLNHVWDFGYEGTSNIIDAHIKNLRKKLQNKNETIFETVHGIGYRFRT